MSVYVQYPDGSLTPAQRGSSMPLGLRPETNDRYVVIEDADIKPARTLEQVIMDWEYGSFHPRPETPRHLADLADRIRAAYPEYQL